MISIGKECILSGWLESALGVSALHGRAEWTDDRSMNSKLRAVKICPASLSARAVYRTVRWLVRGGTVHTAHPGIPGILQGCHRVVRESAPSAVTPPPSTRRDLIGYLFRTLSTISKRLQNERFNLYISIINRWHAIDFFQKC